MANKKYRCVNNTGVEKYVSGIGRKGVCHGKKERYTSSSGSVTEEEKMKYEIADELGLLDRIMKDGWKSLSSKETGRIGGILARKRKNRSKK